MAKNSLSSIQAMRAVAALAVLICHIGAIEGKYMGFRLLPEWGMYGVDIFFVISGFIMTYVASNVGHTPKDVGRFLVKRALRIYPVYWQFTSVVLIVLWLKPEWMNLAASGNPPSVIKSLLLWPQMMDPHLGVGWSLVYEMYFYLMFAAGLLLLRDKMLYGWCVWVCVLLVCAYLDIAATTTAAEVRLITSPYSLHFLLGCAVAWFYQKEYRVSPLLIMLTALLVATGGLFVADAMYGTVILYTQPMMRVFAIGIPSALLVWGLLMLERANSITYPAWLCRVGDASYSLYLLHSLLISAMGKLWLHLHAESMAAHAIYIIAMACAAVTLALLNYHFFEKPLSRWYHKRLAS